MNYVWRHKRWISIAVIASVLIAIVGVFQATSGSCTLSRHLPPTAQIKRCDSHGLRDFSIKLVASDTGDLKSWFVSSLQKEDTNLVFSHKSYVEGAVGEGFQMSPGDGSDSFDLYENNAALIVAVRQEGNILTVFYLQN